MNKEPFVVRNGRVLLSTATANVEVPEECECPPAVRWNQKGLAGPLYLTKVEGRSVGGPRIVLSQPGGFEVEIVVRDGALRLQKATG